MSITLCAARSASSLSSELAAATAFFTAVWILDLVAELTACLAASFFMDLILALICGNGFTSRHFVVHTKLFYHAFLNMARNGTYFFERKFFARVSDFLYNRKKDEICFLFCFFLFISERGNGARRMIFLGMDLCEVSRWDRILKRYPGKLSKVFTEEEIRYARGRASSLAAFWAAREATLKALGIGFRGDMKFSDVSVTHDEAGAPHLVLKGAAKKRAELLEVSDLAVSLSHERNMAAAVVEARREL